MLQPSEVDLALAAEIIAIGTEILLGEIQDTNTRFLARHLRDAGIDLYRTMTVGDNTNRIAQAIQEAMGRAQIIITTGGLGPTVDDPTRQAVALAVGAEPVFVPELWDQIQARFQRYGRQATENNRRQAYIPTGALPVENPVGTAPAFIVETETQAIIALPGVPREMEYLYEYAVLPYIRRRFGVTGVIKARALHTVGAGESMIDDLIGDLEQQANPTVGLSAHAGQVDIRITAKAASEAEAERLIDQTTKQVKARLGSWIYGQDNETLEGLVAHLLNQGGHRLALVECGTNGELVHRLLAAGAGVDADCPDEFSAETAPIEEILDQHRARVGARLALAVRLVPGTEKQTLTLCLQTANGDTRQERTYGGPPQLAPAWAANLALDILRKSLTEVN